MRLLIDKQTWQITVNYKPSELFVFLTSENFFFNILNIRWIQVTALKDLSRFVRISEMYSPLNIGHCQTTQKQGNNIDIIKRLLMLAMKMIEKM